MRRFIALAVSFFALCLVTSAAQAQTTTVPFDGVLDDGMTPFSGTYTLADTPVVSFPFFIPGTFGHFVFPFGGELTIGGVTASANNSLVTVGNDRPVPVGGSPVGTDFWGAFLWGSHPAVSCPPGGFCLCAVALSDPDGVRLSSTDYSVQTSFVGWPIANLICINTSDDVFDPTFAPVLLGEIFNLDEVVMKN